jgi:hypothetical protein
MCPRGCRDIKIKFSDKCLDCSEDFMYFVIEKRIRKKEDLFTSDEEIELWSCNKCDNHNIDVKKNCRKCNRNKYIHNQVEKKEINEKLKIWYW